VETLELDGERHDALAVESFDAAISRVGLIYFPDQQAALRGMWRALKPGGKLAGIVSERDYARKVVLQGRSSRETAVREIMTAPVVTIGLDDTAAHCMQLVTDRRIRHLPVVENGHVLGVVSIGDLVRAVIEDQQLELDQLQRYIAG